MASFTGVRPERLRNATLPPNLLPLLDERTPFSPFSDDAIRAFIDFRSLFPETLGRLSATLDSALNVSTVCPARFMVLEAHIDLARAVASLENRLVSIGFEPDHFVTLNPIEYRRCFTLKFEIDRSITGFTERSRILKKELLKRLRLAIDATSLTPNLPAYAEAEVYTDRTKATFDPFSAFSIAGLTNSPLSQVTFITESAAAGGSAPWGGKAIDIHIKLPTPEKGVMFKQADHPSQIVLAEYLRSIGFYEIASYSGKPGVYCSVD